MEGVIEAIDDLINKPITEYLPGINLRSDYDFQIFKSARKNKGKRTLNEFLQAYDDHTPDQLEDPMIIDISDDEGSNLINEVSDNIENNEIKSALQNLDFEIDDKFKSVLKLHQVRKAFFLSLFTFLG